MNKKLAFLVFAFVLMAAAVLDGAFAASISDQYADLSAVESNIASRINGTSIYNYNLQLENIALNHSLSFYSFRSSGSAGANVTAAWIQGQFESFGELQTQMEPFNFTTWSLLAQPVLVINADVNLVSFQCEHYSCPTPDEGVNASLVTLHLPYDPAAWIAVDTTGPRFDPVDGMLWPHSSEWSAQAQ